MTPRTTLGWRTKEFKDSIAGSSRHGCAETRGPSPEGDRHPTTATSKRRRTMNRDLGVWTNDDCALVLIDYQREMFEVIRSETDADLVELNVRLLARTAKALDVPIVLSTVGVGYGFNGPTQPAILAELPGVEVIDRTSMNAFEDQRFREAVA